jgi:hypothetical protein
MGLELILMDIRGIFADIRPHDLGPFFFWGLWVLVVFSSLRGVDRRDELAQVTFMAMTAAFGVLYVMVFPIGKAQNSSPQKQIILFSVLILVPSIRWMMKRSYSDLDRRVVEARAEKSKSKGA